MKLEKVLKLPKKPVPSSSSSRWAATPQLCSSPTTRPRAKAAITFTPKVPQCLRGSIGSR